MLHAPSSEAKQQNPSSSTSPSLQPEHRLHPYLSTAAGPRLAAVASDGLPLNNGSERGRQAWGDLQKTYGNQAVLLMLSGRARTALAPASAGVLQRKCACGASGGECESCKEERKSPLFRAPEDRGGQPGPVNALPPPIVHEVLRSPGRPLDPAIRRFFEPRFTPDLTPARSPGDTPRPALGRVPAAPRRPPQAKLTIGEPGDRQEQQAELMARAVMDAGETDHSPGYDFSGVRIHTDAKAAESARALQARAYTVGSDIVFGDCQYAAHTSEGRRLIAHELTHVVQQGSASVAHRLQRDLIYGSDYKSPYKTDDAETRSAEAKTWYPSTVDFAATASGSGGGTGAPSFDDLIKTIAAKGKGSISSLGIIGHATTDLISLSGTITVNPMNVTFTGAGVIDSAGIKSRMSAITPVRDRFATGAKIILYGCHAGIGNSLLADLSSAFQVCVHGFSDEVWWCINWDMPARTINSRGRTWVDSAGLMAGGLLTPSCLKDFNADIGQLKPDKKDCSGVPGGPTPTPKATPQGTTTESAAPEAVIPESAPPAASAS